MLEKPVETVLHSIAFKKLSKKVYEVCFQEMDKIPFSLIEDRSLFLTTGGKKYFINIYLVSCYLCFHF